MNVDEAIKVFRECEHDDFFGLSELFDAGVILSREVERLSVWKQRWRDVACKLRVQLSNCGTMESELTRARMERDSWRRVAEKLMSERGEVNDE